MGRKANKGTGYKYWLNSNVEGEGEINQYDKVKYNTRGGKGGGETAGNRTQCSHTQIKLCNKTNTMIQPFSTSNLTLLNFVNLLTCK